MSDWLYTMSFVGAQRFASVLTPLNDRFMANAA
ncbi:hypothetical protein EMIT0P44_200014 [Pseudomonas sp. IT-P44]